MYTIELYGFILIIVHFSLANLRYGCWPLWLGLEANPDERSYVVRQV